MEWCEYELPLNTIIKVQNIQILTKVYFTKDSKKFLKKLIVTRAQMYMFQIAVNMLFK